MTDKDFDKMNAKTNSRESTTSINQTKTHQHNEDGWRFPAFENETEQEREDNPAIEV
jgi:hypothetical protein